MHLEIARIQHQQLSAHPLVTSLLQALAAATLSSRKNHVGPYGPTRAQMGSIWAQMGLIWIHVGPDGPIWAQMGSIWAQMGPMWTHVAQMGPYGPHMGSIGAHIPRRQAFYKRWQLPLRALARIYQHALYVQVVPGASPCYVKPR